MSNRLLPIGDFEFIHPAAFVLPLLPGVALAAAVAVAAVTAGPVVALVLPVPTMVLALIVGIAVNAVAKQPAFAPGLRFV